ncbi:unnamed protein product [Didymodactylos carnosus]|uniref:Uncharacterized protein n=1 Tax=Didymodactylos carnosus TaxID=1234261 RepID=A0A813PPT3_9BILA|nr:unnamed protein product [Didymodactylos carnosus]CAF0838554.1 unnamed protein product [Didymodactylos carnosus]CAF3534447.1 unnamed protein product [Didymodactylos carnosus]CAF3623463.1 unnamed protein product [Didymodactylos carnosus]
MLSSTLSISIIIHCTFLLLLTITTIDAYDQQYLTSKDRSTSSLDNTRSLKHLLKRSFSHHLLTHIPDYYYSHENENIQYSRKRRGTGYFVIRNGDYLYFIPDSKHPFTKNMRPYIGRRKR